MASKRHIRRKQCTGKKRHASLSEAISATRAIRKAKGEQMGAYRCVFCGGFHIGHRSSGSALSRIDRLSRLTSKYVA